MHLRVIILIAGWWYLWTPVPAQQVLPLDCDCNTQSDTLWVTHLEDSGQGSLRCAISCANLDNDHNFISFDLDPGSDSTLSLTGNLPTLFGHISLINDTGFITIDGSQLLLEGDYGLRINGDSVTIAGFIIENFPNNGIDNYQAHKHIVIENNIIRKNGRVSEFGDGIDFRFASQSTIRNNVIQENRKDGIYMQICVNTTIMGNQVVSNKKNGILIFGGKYLIVGDSCHSCANQISGNLENGVRILENARHISLFNNTIGLNLNQGSAFANRLNGLSITRSDSLIIGSPGRGNIISGNYISGIEIVDSSSHIDISSNRIGFAGMDDFGIPNGLNGIRILRSDKLRIGGETVSQANKIGFQPHNIYLGDSSRFCSVRHNSFGCGIYNIRMEPGCNMDIAPVTDFFIDDAFTITGTAVPGSEIQVYRKNEACTTCQGNEFLGSVFTFTGSWVVNLDKPLMSGDFISVLTTDFQSNTSIFSVCLQFDCDAFNVEILNDNDDELCAGSILELYVDQGQEFFWSTGETGSSIEISQGGEYSVTVLNEAGCPDADTVFISEIPSPELVLLPADSTIFCDYSIILKAEGEGFFTWDDGTQGKTREVFESGTYCVSVTNVYGCSVTDCITVIKGKHPSAEILALGETSFCNGEYVDLVALGGSTVYWNTGQYNEDTIRVYQGGEYAVTVVNEDGCEDYAEKSVEVYPLPLASIEPSGNIQICYGDSIRLTAFGGVTYAWNTGEKLNEITVDKTGIYFVTVTNEFGCTDAAYQSLSVNPEIQADLMFEGSTSFCEGDSLILWIEGNQIDSVIWNEFLHLDTVMVFESGLYKAQIYSFGCAVSDSIEVEVWSLPDTGIIWGPTWSYPDSVQIFSVLDPDEELIYLWEVDGGIILAGDSSSVIEVLWERDDQGLICAVALDSHLCQSAPFCKTVDLAPLNIKEKVAKGVLWYPNPTKGKISLELPPGSPLNKIRVVMHHGSGQRIRSIHIDLDEFTGKGSIDLSGMPEGNYWISTYADQVLLDIRPLIISR